MISVPSNKQLPNFLIVGAAKSGTTSLYKYLSEHPEIFLSNKLKETFFLTGKKFKQINPNGGHYGSNAIYSYEEYLSLFKNVKDERAIGEICTGYLYFAKETIPNIKKYLGSPTIIMILRNPIDRAYSNYLHTVRDGYEFESFEQSLKLAQIRKEQSYWWGYRHFEAGLYFEKVKLYINNFNKVHIYLFEDIIEDTAGLIEKICTVLGIDSKGNYKLLDQKFNTSGIPKNKIIHNILAKPKYLPSSVRRLAKQLISKDKLEKLKRMLINQNLEKPKMKQETRIELINLYRESILKLQGLINRDLSHWLNEVEIK